MTKKKILVVDDEINIVELLTMNLEKNGFEVISCLTGEEGVRIAKNQIPDLILLDIMLPGISGVEVCSILQDDKLTYNIPIIMLTAKVNERDKIIGLEIGADDYITKPFSVRELLARINALLRRIEKNTNIVEMEVVDENLIELDDLVIDTENYLVRKNDKKVELTAKEFAVLSILAVNKDKIYTREELLREISEDDISAEPRSIDVHMANLRKKIGKSSSGKDYIETIRRKGYRINL